MHELQLARKCGFIVEGLESLSGRANETLNQLSTSTWITYEAKHARIHPLALDKMVELQNWREWV